MGEEQGSDTIKGWNQSKFLSSAADLLVPSLYELKALVQRRTERY
jgi:hypothetical protein